MENFMELEHYIKHNPNRNHKLFIKENSSKEINMDQVNIIIILMQIHIIKEIGIIILNKVKESILLIKEFIKDNGLIIKNIEKVGILKLNNNTIY